MYSAAHRWLRIMPMGPRLLRLLCHRFWGQTQLCHQRNQQIDMMGNRICRIAKAALFFNAALLVQ